MPLSIQKQIVEIISERKKNLPKVKEQYARIKDDEAKTRLVITRIDELLQFKNKIDEDVVHDLIGHKEELEGLIENYGTIITDLGNLEVRFNRDTINIGVSGAARVGKSTTLQSFSGLDDTQIPTGATGLPVTAVKSEIFNDSDSYALVEFRDADSFIANYIKPLLDNINAIEGQALTITSISQLRSASLPETLGENIDSTASKSLIYLKEAQESLDTYASLLTGTTETKSIDEIRRFVAYPTDEEIASGKVVDRAYLAVSGVKIFSKFPSLEDEKVGIIDLPGLGEIGKSAESIHTSGLENNVDQILLIMRPTSSSGFVDTGISNNIDQLRLVQPGITRRSDLIVAAINNDDSNSETSKTLRRSFESTINSTQTTDKIQVIDFKAVDESSVHELFHALLEKLAMALPSMDRDVYDYIMQQGLGGLNRQRDLLFDEIAKLTNRIMKTIPLEDSYLDELADELSRMLVYEYDEIEESRHADASRPNPLRNKLEQQVTAIYDDNKKKIDEGLFLRNNAIWLKHAKGQPDYVNFLRSEAKRVRAEIVDSYRGVDVFYDFAIQELKAQVLSVFYASTGTLYQKIGVNPEDATSPEDIEKLVDELDAITRNEEFTHCFKFISEVSFKFSQNVFYNIYTSLEDLHNPDANQKLGGRGLSGQERMQMVEKDLKTMAHRGNAEIKKRILEYNDSFNVFLYTCMSFFNDFLYRKDAKTYERCIRALLKGCREYVVSDEEYQVDRDLLKATKRLREAVSVQRGVLQSDELTKVSMPIATTESPIHDDANTSESEIQTTHSAQLQIETRLNVEGARIDKVRSGYKSKYNQEW